MRLRNRHLESPEVRTVPNHVEDTHEDVTETLSCGVTGDSGVEAVLGEADDRSRSSASAAIVSAVADNFEKSESSSSIPEHDNVTSAPSPSPIPSEHSNRNNGSGMEVINRDTPVVSADGSKTFPAPSWYDDPSWSENPDLFGQAQWFDLAALEDGSVIPRYNYDGWLAEDIPTGVFDTWAWRW